MTQIQSYLRAGAVGASVLAAVMFTRKRGGIPMPDGDDQHPFNVNNNGPAQSIENPVFNQMENDDPFDNDFEEAVALHSLP